MTSLFNIQQAENRDKTEVAGFLAHASLVHRHLDWQGVLDWIPMEPFLLLRQDNRLQALLTCPTDREKIAWIRCFACGKFDQMQHCWDSLFREASRHQKLVGATIYSVGLNDWFADLLFRSRFENFQNIVVLQWDRHLLSAQRTSQSFLIRPMEQGDLDEVAELDQTAFEPIWVNPPDKIKMAYTQSEHSSVLEIDGKIIGYEMTTANHFSAHLARIAVHPDHQKQHIGTDLILEMLNYFKRKGIDQISVNTQDSNTSSLALYRSLGFKFTGESFPVFRYQI
jgi:ribosomal-protein-alanine N-acetyltransferase